MRTSNSSLTSRVRKVSLFPRRTSSDGQAKRHSPNAIGKKPCSSAVRKKKRSERLARLRKAHVLLRKGKIRIWWGCDGARKPLCSSSRPLQPIRLSRERRAIPDLTRTAVGGKMTFTPYAAVNSYSRLAVFVCILFDAAGLASNGQSKRPITDIVLTENLIGSLT